MSFVKWTLVLFSAAEVFAFQSHPSVIGDGIGLDHIMIGLPGNTQAEDVFAKRLGFSVLPGTPSRKTAYSRLSFRSLPPTLNSCGNIKSLTDRRA
jgi:hypothetical protein